MNSEVESFIKVWSVATLSLCYSYIIPRRLPKGFIRLLSLLPVISLFSLLPLSLSTIHLCGLTAFFLTWLASFKLLLFSFSHGPLSSPHLPFSHFLAIASLPISPQSSLLSPQSANSPINFGIKALLLAAIVRIYDYRPRFHRFVISALYCCNVYLGVELALALSAGLARAALGLESEPQFREPYLATSLQDFWGRRWNLMVPRVLRATVYDPVRRFSASVLGRACATAAGTVAAFLVSGVMHELIYFYLTRAGPTWEVTCFFVLQGACTAAEVAAKKAVARSGTWRLSPLVSGPVVVGFVAITGEWLFMPQIKRSGVDLKAIEEYHVFSKFAREYVFFALM